MSVKLDNEDKCADCGCERWKHYEGYAECDRSCGCSEFDEPKLAELKVELDQANDPQTITTDEIITLMVERGMTIQMVIDAVIEANGIVGVGLITLEELVSGHIRGIRLKNAPSYESFMNT